MSKTCVFIMGTNATGKTSLAKELINRYGGIASSDKTLTVCNDSRMCLAGHYDLGKTFGGVDGFSQTRCLEDVVFAGLQQHEAIICEGMYLHTFGMNLINAMFVAKKQLIVFLYAPVTEIHRRLLNRSGKGIANEAVWRKQQNTATAIKKWASIGVPVLSYDTSKTAIKDIADQVTEKIEQLICSK